MALLALAQREAHRSDRRRSRTASRSRHRRSLPSHGLRIFGPSRAAAQLECSKVFAKAFMARHGIPTARYRVCDAAAGAHAVIASRRARISVVVKADGLAAGKGVVVAPDRAERRRGGSQPRWRSGSSATAGARVVLEECLDRTRGVVLRDLRRHRAVPLIVGAGSQARLRRRQGAEHRRHGRVRAEPAAWTPALQARMMREIVEPGGARACARRDTSTAGFSTPA